jgi:hypothetical protein
MKMRRCLMGAAMAVGLMTGGAAVAGTANLGAFTVTATNSQSTTAFAGAATFADSNDFAGYAASLATSVATITGGALNPAGSTNPGTGFDGSIANYLSAFSGNSETIMFNANQKYFGALWGSVDATNTVSFFENNTLVATITGSELESDAVALQGYPANGSFVDFVANGSNDYFNKIVLSEGSTFFETDNLAAAAAVPEPGVWALMLLGIGALGLSLRAARQRSPSIAAL